jgi:hypothetical protein
MSQLKESGRWASGAVRVTGFSVSVFLAALACSSERDASAEPPSARKASVLPSARVTVVAAADVARPTSATKHETPAVPSTTPSTQAAAPKAASATKAVTASGLTVKRFVVTSGVHEREPVSSAAALLADGKPVYAFAELVNADSAVHQVSFTFERQGSSKIVGFATLPVPANTSRHRTWANTRLIAEPGTWEAVLRTESGVELSRASFEVAAQ